MISKKQNTGKYIDFSPTCTVKFSAMLNRFKEVDGGTDLGEITKRENSLRATRGGWMAMIAYTLKGQGALKKEVWWQKENDQFLLLLPLPSQFAYPVQWYAKPFLSTPDYTNSFSVSPLFFSIL